MLADILGALTVLGTLVVIIVAFRTLREARKTTAELQTAVTKLGAIVGAQENAVRELRSLVGATQAAATQASTAAAEADSRAKEAADRSEAAAIAAAAREQAATERADARDQATFLQRRYERVLQVGATIEDIFWRTDPRSIESLNISNESWMPQRNRLMHQIVGLSEAIPSCQQIIDAASPIQASQGCVTARQEVERELDRIDGQLAALRA